MNWNLQIIEYNLTLLNEIALYGINAYNTFNMNKRLTNPSEQVNHSKQTYIVYV